MISQITMQKKKNIQAVANHAQTVGNSVYIAGGLTFKAERSKVADVYDYYINGLRVSEADFEKDLERVLVKNGLRKGKCMHFTTGSRFIVVKDSGWLRAGTTIAIEDIIANRNQQEVLRVRVLQEHRTVGMSVKALALCLINCEIEVMI